MRRVEHELLSPSLGSSKKLVSLHFGTPGVGLKVYIQASLHAEELPGMLVAHHLRQMLTQADASGSLTGEVVLVPAANPVGLAQRMDHHAQGRFEFDTSENFNRHYPDLAAAVWPDLTDRLGEDIGQNVQQVRSCVASWLLAWQPATELHSLRRQLLLLAHDADVVLDLHCDCEAVLHIYSEEACWAPLEPLARLLKAQAVLLARESGGGPFDERLSGLWWQLRERMIAAGLPDALPQACASTTVELRGESDVRHDLALQDAQAILGYLAHLGVVQNEKPPLPPLLCAPTPLSGSQTLRSPVPGVLALLVRPGQLVRKGQVVAEVIDPTAEGQSRVCEVRAEVDGVLYATVRERYVHANGEIGKIAGAVPYRTGDLLGA
jgi:uncharacterized protein